MSAKLKDGAVPVFPSGCPSYYSQCPTKRSRLSLDSKEDEFLNQALSLSLKSDTKEREKFKVACFEDIQAKLSFISLPKAWSLWYPVEHRLVFMRPNLENSCIMVDRYLLVQIDLSLKAFCNNEIFPLSQSCLSDIRQLETLLGELSCAYDHCKPSKNSKSTTKFHISSAKSSHPTSHRRYTSGFALRTI